LFSRKITAERAIGRHTINEIPAEGGWSIVYKGCHSFLNLPVAIKMLKHNMARDPDLLDRFRNEAKIIAGLNQENIVKVYDIEQVPRTVFIVMEYLEGVTLRHILKNKLRMPFRRMVKTSAGLQNACENLVKSANDKGGTDNITVLLVGSSSEVP
jgi:eukaryotic-like serine/threonine-protein kinase